MNYKLKTFVYSVAFLFCFQFYKELFIYTTKDYLAKSAYLDVFQRTKRRSRSSSNNLQTISINREQEELLGAEMLPFYTKPLDQMKPNELYMHLEPQLKQKLANANEHYWIIMWYRPFNKTNYIKNISAEECGNCTFTYDRTKLSGDKRGAVVFHFNELKINSMPKIRFSNQLYVWFSQESPWALKEGRNMSLTEYDNVFNLTMSYRRDSDIVSPYGDAANVTGEKYIPPGEFSSYMRNMIAAKTGVAVWFVSNCGYTEGAKMRLQYVQSLVDAGLPVRRRGHCFNDPLDGNQTEAGIRNYKFYLAFENQLHCRDYITEKLWKNAYLNDAVPIVFGAAKEEYEAVAPPGSFIFAEDYTPTELVRLVLHLDKTPEHYARYFAWRSASPKDTPTYGKPKSFCQLCRIMHGINIDNIYSSEHKKRFSDIPYFEYSNRSRIIPSLKEHVYDKEQKECLYPGLVQTKGSAGKQQIN